MPVAEIETIDLINQLATLDLAAADAYEAAADKVQDEGLVSCFREFQRDHERHVRELAARLEQHGEEVEDKPEIERRLPFRSYELEDCSEQQIVEAMRDNEAVTNEMYARCARTEGIEDDLRQLFERNLADAHRHLSWLERRLEHVG